jgi:hypothetical protein
MNITVPIPDGLAKRGALESLSLEAYKAGRITNAELRRLLGFETRYELDGFLKAHDVWMNFTIDDLRRDVATLQQLGF